VSQEDEVVALQRRLEADAFDFNDCLDLFKRMNNMGGLQTYPPPLTHTSIPLVSDWALKSWPMDALLHSTPPPPVATPPPPPNTGG
jgi:hypothetical protein